MIWKILLTLAALVLVWLVLFRARPARKRRPPRVKTRGVKAQDLIKCDGCGIYLPAGQTCDCRDHA